MKATALVVLLACGAAWADPGMPAEDAPVFILKAGEASPSDGLLLSPANAVKQAQRVTACEVERDTLKTSVTPAAWWVIAIVGVLALGAGIGAGYGISKLPPPK